MYEKTLRQSQTISPFGPGAIFSIAGESFVPRDAALWDKQNCIQIKLERLEKHLGVNEFRSAPVMENSWGKPNRSLPVDRFPKWLFCPKCRILVLWTIIREQNTGDNGPAWHRGPGQAVGAPGDLHREPRLGYGWYSDAGDCRVRARQ